MIFSEKELYSIYELGKLYYDMGYFSAAERVFSGLIEIDGGDTPSLLGLGLVKFERGQYEEASLLFMKVMDKTPEFELEARIALGICLVALKDYPKARVVLEDVTTRLGDSSSQTYKLASAYYKKAQSETSLPAI